MFRVHPFPARMAPDLAVLKTKDLQDGAVLLDPMVGSGTVVRAAANGSFKCIGLDLDPLAILISRVSTSSVDQERLAELAEKVVVWANSQRASSWVPPWMDDPTKEFIAYWFAKPQRESLTLLTYGLEKAAKRFGEIPEVRALRLALSKIIITKDKGASLARDVSHSRPHRVIDTNDFDVFAAFNRVVGHLGRGLAANKPRARINIRQGDARKMQWIRGRSVDLIITSPPYLNAIDYMRGHRLSLVWLGYSLESLARIRTTSVGAERSPDAGVDRSEARIMAQSTGAISKLPERRQRMVERYCLDLMGIMGQAARVLKPDGKAIFVVGNSCLKNVFIQNTKAVEAAARHRGLKLTESVERILPASSRYLPMPKEGTKGALAKRMRTETVMTFCAAK